MWFPKKLIIQDLMSIENATIEFSNGSATLIYGKNDFDEDQESNGSGKSAILEAISIALRNKPLRDATTSELVREGSKSSVIKFELTNSITKQTLLIERIIHSNTKPSELKVFVNDKQITTIVSVNDGNDYILKQIGISQEDLINYYLINKEKYTPFLKMSDSKKKEMISRFSQSSLVDPLFDQLDREIKSEVEKKSVVETTIHSIESKIEVLQESIDAYDPDQLKLNQQTQIEQVTEEIDQLKLQIKQHIKQTSADQKNIDATSQLIDNLPKTTELLKRIDAIEQDEQECNDNIKAIRKDIREANEILNQIQKNLAGKVACPKCTHEFIVGKPNIDISKQKKKKVKISQILLECDEDKKAEEEILELLEEKKQKFRDQIKTIDDSKRDFQEKIDDYQLSQRRNTKQQQEKESELKRKQEKLKKLTDPKQEQEDSLITQLKNQQIQLKKDLKEQQIKQQPIDKIHSQLLEETSILSQFKTHLANKAIGSFESHANDYLNKTGSELAIQLDGYKVTKSSKAIRENITATILRNGSANNFGRMSSGEKARIEIAFIVAPQSLINSSCQSGGLDLLFMDEIVESVDSKGIGGILKSLNQIDRTIFVVTHATYNKPYPHTLTVHKHANGIATIQ